MVLLDKSFLESLPRRHLLNGICEIIKLAIIKDVELFRLLEEQGAHCINSHFQDDLGSAILEQSITAMMEELQPNLFEENLNRKVDFGHTFCYGLETHHEADLLHGEAVMLDIALSVLIARERKLLSKQEADRIFRMVDRLGIVLNAEILDPYLLWQCLEERICHRNGWQSVPFPSGIGNCVFINDVRLDEIRAAVESLRQILVENKDEIRQLR